MTIEIVNNGLSGQPPTPGEETNMGVAQKNNNTSTQNETGKPVDSIDISENAETMNSLQQTIANLPVVDPQKVEEMSNNVNNRTLDILGNIDQRLAASERIAEKIMNFESQLPNNKQT